MATSHKDSLLDDPFIRSKKAAIENTIGIIAASLNPDEQQELQTLANPIPDSRRRFVPQFLRRRSRKEPSQGGVLGTDALHTLIKEQQIILPVPEKIDSQSVDLHLADTFFRVNGPITVGESIREDQIERFTPDDGWLVLKPGEFVLGVTTEGVWIPPEYMGFLQTKGSIARLGVVGELDMQSYSGSRNRLTLQIINHNPPESDVTIRIPVGHPIVALHLLTVVGDATPYGEGNRYQGASLPTTYVLDNK